MDSPVQSRHGRRVRCIQLNRAPECAGRVGAQGRVPVRAAKPVPFCKSGVSDVLKSCRRGERVVDQDVEPTLLVSDPAEQGGHLVVVGVIYGHGDPGAAPSGDLCSCVADSARQFVLSDCSGTAGDVHRGTTVSEGHRDAFADAAACSSDDGDCACQRAHSVVSSVAGVQQSSKNLSL
jgi:hypothetical protein